MPSVRAQASGVVRATPMMHPTTKAITQAQAETLIVQKRPDQSQPR